MNKMFAIAAVAVGAAASLSAQFDRDRVIPGGGISVQGWTGKIDAGSVRHGRTLNDSKFAQDANAIHVIAGPATTIWEPGKTASRDYNLNTHVLEPQVQDLYRYAHY